MEDIDEVTGISDTEIRLFYDGIDIQCKISVLVLSVQSRVADKMKDENKPTCHL